MFHLHGAEGPDYCPQGIVPLCLWKANQQECKARNKAPITASKPIHEYLLSAIGFCWECHTWDGRQASLHGVTGNAPERRYYRYSTIHNENKTRRKVDPQVFTGALQNVGISAEEQTQHKELLARHRPTLRQPLLEEQINQLVAQLEIPTEWHELILAYYLSDGGMSEFERNSFNLRQELARQRGLFKRGHITQAEYEQAFLIIDRQLQRLQPSAQQEAREVYPLLKDFHGLWQQMTLAERQSILRRCLPGCTLTHGIS